jgi:hypothetical protein
MFQKLAVGALLAIGLITQSNAGQLLSTQRVKGLSADLTAPVIDSISVEGNPNVGLANPNVTVTLEASDDLSGVYEATIALQAPGSETFALEFHLGDHPLHLVRHQQVGVGRAGQGVGFYRFSEPGTWHVSRVHLEDLAGNVREYNAAELALLGNTSFQVTNARYDGVQPTLIKGEILTPVISLSSELPFVQTSVTVKDAGTNAPSGVDYVALYYCLPPVVDFKCADYLQSVGSFGTPAKSKATLATGYPAISILPGNVTRSEMPGTASVGTYELSHVIIVTIDGVNAGYYSPLIGGGHDLRQWFPSLTVTVVP